MAIYKVKRGILGDVVRGGLIELTDEQAQRHARNIERVDESEIVKHDVKGVGVVVQPEPIDDLAVFLDQSPIKVITSVNTLLDIKLLESLKTLESKGQKRTGVIKAIDIRALELSNAKVDSKVEGQGQGQGAK